MDSSQTENGCFTILMFPWLAHGHIFPYLELAKRILKRKKFHIYFCSTAINSSSIKSFIQESSLGSCIDFIELRLEPSPELPPHYHTTKNLPSHLILTLLKAFQQSRSSFYEIISSLRPDLVIFDIYQPWAATVAASKGIPAVHFVGLSAATYCFVHHNYVCWDENFPFHELSLEEHEKESLGKLVEFARVNVFDGDKDVGFVSFNLSCDVVLAKTSRGFEGKYVDYLSRVSRKKILAVGPLVTDIRNEDGSEVMQWLSKKEPHSTVYISFGSEYFLSKDEIGEIAKGLELCDVNFIWVIRFPVGESEISVEEALPQGFLDRVKDRGIVVSGWSPQANILAHPSTGGFVSHCGWSSLNESIYFGVPIIGMPMKLNMFVDARMLGAAGVCIEVPRDEDKVYKGEKIAEVINKVILGQSGEELRMKARELSEGMKMEEEQALDETAEHLWQICSKNKLKE